MVGRKMNKNSHQNDAKKRFKLNLLETIKEIPLFKEVDIGKNVKFVICLDKESNKNHNSDDDYMRLGTLLYSEELHNRVFELDQIINMLVHPGFRYPLWVDVSIHEIKEDSIIVKIKTSSRFRRPSELLNKETGHPPFRAVY